MTNSQESNSNPSTSKRGTPAPAAVSGIPRTPETSRASASADAAPAEAGFQAFGLHKDLLRAVVDLGFKTPRPIQVQAIPEAMRGRDVMGLAQTGTGKTAAFALPLLHHFHTHQSPGPRALILAPTRELASQIAREFELLAKYTQVKVVTIFGGVSQRPQVAKLRARPAIVVGCPGRVLDLIQQGLLKLRDADTLVLDEADQMFDMGFLPTIRKIMATMPDKRQNLLFSATMPKEIRHLADDLLLAPKVVELANSAPVETVDHALVLVPETQKRDLLDQILGEAGCSSAIIFTRTKHRARRLAEQLERQGHKAIALQGNMSQNARDRAMGGFRSKRYKILVATDIAARGIDVSGVSHVINYDVPTTPEAYTHRIGRTGRAELSGIACTFVTGTDHGWLRATERLIGSKIKRLQVDGIEADPEREGVKPQQRGRGGYGGGGGRRGPGAGKGGGAARRRNSPGGPPKGRSRTARKQSAGRGRS